MGDNIAELSPDTQVLVSFEDGNVVPATVMWTDDGLVGLAFGPTVLLDKGAQ